MGEKILFPELDQNLLALEEKVDTICGLCSRWYSGPDVESRTKKQVAELEEEVSPQISSLLSQPSRKQKAFGHYLAGKLAIVLGTLDEAEESLTKGLKRDMTLYRAWAYLGEIYMQRKKYSLAYEFLHRALKDTNHAEGFRLLSQLIRIILKEGKFNIIESIDDAIEYARISVSLSPKNSVSWQLMGNALLDQYFQKESTTTSGVANDSLKGWAGALQAYVMAERNLPSEEQNPDLCFNQAVVCSFTGDFAGALRKLHEAYLLDPRLPTSGKIDQIHRLMKVVGEWRSPLRGPKQRSLDNFSSRIRSYDWNPDMLLKRKLSSFADVSCDENQYVQNVGCAVEGVLMDVVTAEEYSPHGIFVVSDREKNIGIFVLGKVDVNAFRAGDIVAILDPRISDVNLLSPFEDAPIRSSSFRAFLATEPWQILRNNERIEVEFLRTPKLRIVQPSTPKRKKDTFL